LDTREAFGLKYAHFTANNHLKEKRAAKEFLDLVSAANYIPDELRVVEVENAIDSLIVAHKGFNNFHSEVTFAKQLRRVMGENPKIPKGLEKKYIFSLVNVFLTNAYGVATGAEPVYLDLIQKLNPLQATFAVLSITDAEVFSKLQFPLCQIKYKKLLSILKPNIISEPVKDLIVKIESFTGKLDKVTGDKSIVQSIEDLKVLLK
jgi:hypothetical protein